MSAGLEPVFSQRAKELHRALPLLANRYDLLARVILSLVAVVCVAGWAIALRLTPDTKGLGTHKQLGLPECPVAAMTNQGCPTCGMTTAMAWLARGQVVKAAQANMAGLLLGIGLGSTLVWSVSCVVKGRPVGFDEWDKPLLYGAGGLFLFAVTTWGIRICQLRGST